MSRTLALTEQLRQLHGHPPDILLPAALGLLDVARQEGEPQALMEASQAIGRCLLQAGDLPTARQWFQRSLDLSRLQRDPLAEAAIRGQLGLVHLLQGQYEAALEQLRTGRQRLVGRPVDEGLLELLHNSAVALHRMERFDEAAACCQEALATGQVLGWSAREAARCQLNLARSLERAGRLDEAERVCRESLRGLLEAGSGGLMALCHTLQAQIALGRGAAPMAVLLAREAHDSLVACTPLEERLETLLTLGQCEAEAGCPDAALDVFQQALALAGRRNMHVAARDCCVELSRLREAAGDLPGALEIHRQALGHEQARHAGELARMREEARLRTEEDRGGWRHLLESQDSLQDRGDAGAVEDGAPLAICSCCKHVRHEEGRSWAPLESYLLDVHGLVFSHGLCPGCAKQMYEDLLEESTSG
jgi:tetratricopeptide (TPR) repeat protein